MSTTQHSLPDGLKEAQARADRALVRWAKNPAAWSWQDYCRAVGQLAILRAAPCRVCGGSGVMPGVDRFGMRDSCPGCHDGPLS